MSPTPVAFRLGLSASLPPTDGGVVIGQGFPAAVPPDHGGVVIGQGFPASVALGPDAVVIDSGFTASRPPADGGVVIGLGFTSAATPAEVNAALAAALEAARCAWSDVVAVATLESRRGHPALGCLDAPSVLSARGQRTLAVRFYSAAALASVRTPSPSTAVARAVGTASVAEAAALAASGGQQLLVPKRCTPRVCTAVATMRRRQQ